MKKPNRKQIGIIWKIGMVSLIIFVFVQNYYKKRAIESNPFELKAEIIRIENCFKNSRCVVFKYTYDNKTYTDRASSNWSFSNWCKARNHCHGYKFKLTIDKDNPKKHITDWKRLFDEKLFITVE